MLQQSAYRSLYHFFDCYQLHDALQLLQSALRAAAAKKYWQKNAPYQLLFFMHQLAALSKAAFVLAAAKNNYPKAIISLPPSGADLCLQRQYCYHRISSTAWQSIPRHLNQQQYSNPFKALQQFTAFASQKQWQQYLQELTEYALSNCAIDETRGSHHLLSTALLLQRMLEACHLILLRTAA